MPQETLSRINVPELNPYRVTLDPGAEGLSPGLVDFFREQTETLRFEHNKAQAGGAGVPTKDAKEGCHRRYVP